MTVDKAAQWAMGHPEHKPMIYSSATRDVVRKAQELHGRDRSAGAIEAFMARLAVRMVEGGVRRLVVGGGETSGSVVTGLGIGAFSIGPEIDPGVPSLSVYGRPLLMALKSGNFGAIDFYEKAFKALQGARP
jgi:3-dehydrotetronate 4-kinase